MSIKTKICRLKPLRTYVLHLSATSFYKLPQSASITWKRTSYKPSRCRLINSMRKFSAIGRCHFSFKQSKPCCFRMKISSKRPRTKRNWSNSYRTSINSLANFLWITNILSRKSWTSMAMIRYRSSFGPWTKLMKYNVSKSRLTIRMDYLKGETCLPSISTYFHQAFG